MPVTFNERLYFDVLHFQSYQAILSDISLAGNDRSNISLCCELIMGAQFFLTSRDVSHSLLQTIQKRPREELLQFCEVFQ